MNYRFEYFPNETVVELHVNKELINSDWVSGSLSKTSDNEDSIFLSLLNNVEGIKRGLINGPSIRRYKVRVQISPVFDRDETLAKVLKVVIEWVKSKGDLTDEVVKQ